MRREQQIAVVVLTAATWLGAAVFFGFPNTWWEGTRPFLTALTVAGVAIAIYEKFAWSWPVFYKNLTLQPDLRGAWRLRLVSTWVDENTGKPVPPIDGFAQIDQTGRTFCLRIYTSQSHSKTIAHAFSLEQNVYRLSIVYENEPNVELRHTGSPYHKGSAVFNVRGRKPDSIKGDYWTERKTTGSLTLTDRLGGEINSFADGETLYSNRDNET